MSLLLDVEIASGGKDFYPGDIVSGLVRVQAEDAVECEGIRIEAVGACVIDWKQRPRPRSHDDAGQLTTGPREEYLNHSEYLLGAAGAEAEIDPGQHSLPFKFLIPVKAAPSFDGSFGNVWYEVRAVIARPPQQDMDIVVPINVLSKATPDANFQGAETKNEEMSAYCCPLIQHPIFAVSTFNLTLTLPKRIVVPGEAVVVNAQINNKKNDRDMEGSAAAIVRKIAYRSPEGQKMVVEDVIATSEKGRIEARKEDVWAAVEIGPLPPDSPPTGLENCSMIKVDYECRFTVNVDGPGLRLPVKAIVPIFVGHASSSPAPKAITRQPSVTKTPVANSVQDHGITDGNGINTVNA